jgi:phospholipase/lecithinase/hemolysin
MRLRLTLFALSIAALAPPAHAGTISAIYAFGDSLSDAGNDFIVDGGTEPAPPYSGGRFTNGNVWVQDLASMLGLPAVTPSLAGGTDYAFGGALSGNANPGDLTSQLAAFQAANPVANPNGLYTIWIGSNDLNAILAGGPNNLAAIVGNIDSAVTTLAGDGAKDVLVLTVPDLGKTPAAIAGGPAAEAGASALSAAFDSALLSSLALIAASDSALDLSVLDTYSLLDGIVANPAAYGFTNVTQPCLTGEVNYAGGTPCANPGSYLFWDQLHPTAAGQQIVADEAFALITPEPGSASLIALGLVTLGIWKLRANRSCDACRTDSA